MTAFWSAYGCVSLHVVGEGLQSLEEISWEKSDLWYREELSACTFLPVGRSLWERRQTVGLVWNKSSSGLGLFHEL